MLVKTTVVCILNSKKVLEAIITFNASKDHGSKEVVEAIITFNANKDHGSMHSQ